MNKKRKEQVETEKFMKIVIVVGIICYSLSWAILVFKLDLVTYFAFMFYGLGVSGITIYITLKAIELGNQK